MDFSSISYAREVRNLMPSWHDFPHSLVISIPAHTKDRMRFPKRNSTLFILYDHQNIETVSIDDILVLLLGSITKQHSDAKVY